MSLYARPTQVQRQQRRQKPMSSLKRCNLSLRARLVAPGHVAAVDAPSRKYYPRYYNSPTSTGNTTVAAHYPQHCSTQTATANTTVNIPGQYGKTSYEAMASTASAYYPGSTVTIIVDTAAGPSVNTSSPVDFPDPGQLTTHVLSAGALLGAGADIDISGSVGCPTVTATDSGIDVMLASVSHVDRQLSKKRRLDDSE